MAKPKEAGSNEDAAQRRERLLFAHYHRKDLELHAKAKEVAAAQKANRKNANAHGITSARLKHYLDVTMMDDKQKAVDRLKNERQNLEWMGLINRTSNKDLMGQTERVTGEEYVRAQGYEAGLLNKDRVSNYMAGSQEDHWFLTSYDAGKKEYETEIPEILEKLAEKADVESPPDQEDDK